jgi:hypothetical protein
MTIHNILRLAAMHLILLGIASACQTAGARSGTAAAPDKSFGPITDYDSALRNPFDSNQARRSMRYNINSESPELGESSSQNLFDLPPSHSPISTSISDSDTVIIGTVLQGQAYLSGDKRNIYSEFSVSVQEIIKAQSVSLSAGQSIDVERRGGTIRLPSGKILKRGSLAESMPQIGKRYLFLLQYKQDTDSFVLKTGYQLEGTHVYCLDEKDKKDKGDKPLQHPLKEYGATESQLIDQTKKAVSTDKEEN